MHEEKLKQFYERNSTAEAGGGEDKIHHITVTLIRAMNIQRCWN